jgi:hypothetical protein
MEDSEIAKKGAKHCASQGKINILFCESNGSKRSLFPQADGLVVQT